MQGFFDIKPSRKGTKLDCSSCGLRAGCKSPAMEYTGEGKQSILVIAEAPGRDEDQRGKQLIGSAGKLLRFYLDELDIDLDEDCWKTNAINCRPPNNRKPSTKEINCCREVLVRKTIEELQPKKIIVLGRAAIESILDNRIKVDSVSKWVGMKIPDQGWQCWIFPTYHPSYLLRNDEPPAMAKIFSDNLRTAIEWDKPFKREIHRVRIIDNINEAIRYLEKLNNEQPKMIAFDYETTGIRPYALGHEIICMAIASNSNSATVFSIYGNTEFHKELKELLTNGRIKKAAHNMKFEDIWTKEIFGYDVVGWQWDTMIGAHIVDNRSKISGLEFQSYVNFGIVCKDETKKFLLSETTHTPNKIQDAPLDIIMKRCGRDAIFTFRLARMQAREILDNEMIDAYRLFHQGTLAFSDIERTGIKIDGVYYEKQNKILSRKISATEKKIKDSEEIALWKRKEAKEFNPNSGQQLGKLLFDYLKLGSTKQTAGGNHSTDIEALEPIVKKSEFVANILQLKKLNKLQGTYLKGITREIHNRTLYPSFNLHIPVTYRSSSSKPNFQNIPAREKNAEKLIRTGIIPRDGRQLLEVDYSGIEVRIFACYHKDPKMIEYIHNPKSDMHRDEAANLFLLKKKEVTSGLRFVTKNQFVFPQFYGSWWRQCAMNIWNMSKDEVLQDGTPIREHLASKGIDTLYDYEEIVKKNEKVFWKKKFPVFAKWRDNLLNTYEENGYIDFLTKFRCSGYMTRNDVWSYPVQGAAFHCLLWSLIELNFILKQFETKIVGQIHDSIVFDMVPEELDELSVIIRRVMCDDIRIHFPWLIVPLDIDAKISEVNGNWSEMKDYKI